MGDGEGLGVSCVKVSVKVPVVVVDAGELPADAPGTVEGVVVGSLIGTQKGRDYVIRTRAARRALYSVLAGAMVASSSIFASPASAARTIDVHPGQSIQAAVRLAHPGDTIRVHQGVYHQSVLIRKNNITLRGLHAVLREPAHVRQNICNANLGPSGICLLAKEVGPSGEVIKPVMGGRVTGFTIRDFEAFGVATYGANDVTIAHNEAIGNGEYGITSFAASGNKFVDNVATGAGEAGFYYGDSPHADAVIRDNRSFGNTLGVLIRNASHGRIAENKIHGNCAGVFYIAGAPGPVKEWKAVRNEVNRNNAACPGSEGELPPTSGVGIYLGGTHEVKLVDNEVLGNRPTGPTFTSGGIVVETAITGVAPVENVVRHNSAFRNAPYDVRYDGTGKGNVFRDNHCETSSPAWICN